jgi:glycosyltransferase involved in cell wall biosynthesis
VRNDHTSCHSLMVLNQKDRAVPQWLFEAVTSNGGELVVGTSELPLVKKAKWLRELARLSADLVVLHNGSFDVIPTVAFAVHDCPPVVKINNEDHSFWLGSSVSDMVINLRTAGAEHTVNRRFVSSNMVVPVPLHYPLTQVPQRDARRLLGITQAQIVLLSIGRPEKYRPSGPYDFVRTAGKILDRHPEAHLYVVGESLSGIAPYLRSPLHKRLHFVGSIEDPSLYRAAADVYLESFPFGSQTALLEAALVALPVVSAYAPLFPLLVANDDAIQDLIDNPKNEQEYIERVDLLIQQPQRRMELGNILQKRLLIDHVGEGWLKRLFAVYQETDHLTHSPRIIPTSSCSTSEQDIGLSLWHIYTNGKDHSGSIYGDDTLAALSHTAFLAKYVGHYAKARRFAWRALCHDPYRLASWRLLAVMLIGRAAKVIRQALNS